LSATGLTDQERANAWVVRWWRDTEPDERTHEEQRDLAEELGAVRLDERRAIAAWLHRQGTDPEHWLAAAACAELHRMADRIERGEHGT
jgi:hypothetical protein